MADDVFGDSDGDDELALASREFERDLNRIENVSYPLKKNRVLF